MPNLKSKIVLLFFLLLFNTKANSQRNTIFKIDKRKIALDKNLDYFLGKMKTEHFKLGKTKEEIPNFIKEQLPFINNSSLANPNQEFQETDFVTNENLPWRRLVFLCNSYDVYSIVFEQGGYGCTLVILFIKYKDKKVQDIWVKPVICHNLNSIEDILNCINKSREKKYWQGMSIDY